VAKEKRGWAGAGEIMPHLGLDPQNLTNEDDDLYSSLARQLRDDDSPYPARLLALAGALRVRENAPKTRFGSA
jgi:hypothetical protein